jgi:hypothetical protein
MNTDKISIPSPCSEKWSTMTPMDNGRHCSACKETVVDFTSMSAVEIKDYFEKNAGTSICGHYKITQVETPVPIIHKKLLALYDYLQRTISVRFLKIGLLSFVTICLMMSGCKTRRTGYRPHVNADSKKEMHIVLVTDKKLNTI